MKRQHKESIFGLILAALALAIFWLFNKKGLLHESVTSTIGGVQITPQNTIPPDPVTGYPQYDSRFPQTVPAAEPFAIPPIDSLTGVATPFPGNQLTCSCPIGFNKWKNTADGSIWCLPDTGTGAQTGVPIA